MVDWVQELAKLLYHVLIGWVIGEFLAALVIWYLTQSERVQKAIKVILLGVFGCIVLSVGTYILMGFTELLIVDKKLVRVVHIVELATEIFRFLGFACLIMNLLIGAWYLVIKREPV